PADGPRPRRPRRGRPEGRPGVLAAEGGRPGANPTRQARLKQAGFPVDKRLEGFQLSASNLSQATFNYLASLEWVGQARNLALVGPRGTGKSHLAVALRRAAVDAGHRVRLFRADALIEQLYRGLADNSVGRVIDSILRADVVVVDELGFSALDSVAANHLFRLVAAAYETRSLVLTSNWAFELWTNFLPDAT